MSIYAYPNLLCHVNCYPANKCCIFCIAVILSFLSVSLILHFIVVCIAIMYDSWVWQDLLCVNKRFELNWTYSIHVPGWLQIWLNLITAPGSVSNEPGSITWLATKYLKTVSWRNHTEKLTTWWPQNISFWPKINIPSLYFTILMLNYLENTLKLQFDSYVTAVKFLT